jgi:F-type H+-transporting ATPase subunit gamma
MPLLQIKNRFRAINSLSSILAALQVVTVVRLQKVKERITLAQEYAELIKQALAGRVVDQPLTEKKLIVLTASRGLCGDFNDLLKPLTKGFDQVERLSLDQSGWPAVKTLLSALLEDGRELYIAYNNYLGTLRPKPTLYKLFPIPVELLTKKEPADRLLEPSPKELIAALLGHYREAAFYQIVLRSQLSELNARLLVLNNAVENSKELIDQLRLNINKMRQAQITRELTEVVASSEVMRSADNE